MYNPFKTYYYPLDDVPVDTSTDLIKAQHLDPLEKRLGGHTSKPNNVSYPPRNEGAIGILGSVLFLLAGGVIYHIGYHTDDLFSKVFGPFLGVIGVTGIYCSLSTEYRR